MHCRDLARHVVLGDGVQKPRLNAVGGQTEKRISKSKLIFSKSLTFHDTPLLLLLLLLFQSLLNHTHHDELFRQEEIVRGVNSIKDIVQNSIRSPANDCYASRTSGGARKEVSSNFCIPPL